MADYSILQNFKGQLGAQKEAEARALQQQLMQAQIMKAQSGGDSPAALQLADEYAKARAAGDLQRMQDIDSFAKTLDRGVVAQGNGGVGVRSGYGEAVGQIGAAKKGMEQQAEKNVDLVMNPQIRGAEARAGEVGKQMGEKDVLYKSTAAVLPQLETAVGELSDLGKTATYTGAGNLADSFRRQAGLPVGQGAINRTAYIAKVDNQILPLLRDTFGAAFTVKEGETLRATLGDPNKSPKEKDAVLKAFIEQKRANLEALGSQVGAPQDEIDAILQSGLQPVKPRLGNIPMQAAQYLKANPQAAADFDAKYGAGAARTVLGR